ncbi:MAG: VWA domain-containing protein [Planctomycetaceae bacterium]|nr:VWA domain-containing protein [Planctomycetaceae bacterium]
MLRRSYSAPIASLFSSSLMFGLVCGCGAGNDMPTSGAGYSDRAVARSTPSYDESAAAPAPSRPSTSSTSTPSASGPTYSSSTPEHNSRDTASSDITLTEPAPGSRNEHRKDEFVPRSGMQSGLLTAGSFDDVANYNEYLNLLRSNPHVVSNCRLPITADMRQTVLQVTDGQGRPVSHARCIVTSPHNEQNVMLDLCTGSDGRTTLLTYNGNHNLQQQPQRLRLQVFLPGCDTAVIDELRTPQDQWDIVLQQAQSTLPTQLDLALVIDTTGSMGDELDYLKAEIDSIAATVHRMFPNVDQRFSLITYRDQGDEYVCRSFDFTESLSDFRRNLDAQTASGGGDFPEAMDSALHSALQLNWRNSNTARVMFLVGDAPPHAEGAASAVTAINDLRQKGVRIFPVGASGVEKSAEILMRTASVLTMGQYLFLTDHSGVGNAHATPSVSSFAVEKLDRLMIRMIASELAGKRLVPQEVIAIERGEPYSWAAPIPCPQTSCEPYSKPIGYSTQFFVPEPSLLEQLAQWIRRHTMTMAIAVLTFAMVVVENRQHGRCR